MSGTDAGHTLVASAASGVRLQRKALLCLGMAGLFLCFALRELRVGAPSEYLPSFLQIDLFPWAVFAVGIWRASKSGSKARASRNDMLMVLAIALACVPLAGEVSRAGLGLAIGAMGAFLVWRFEDDAQLRAAGICLLALCTNMSIAPLVFRLGYGELIGLDMALLQTAIDFAGAPVTVTPAGLVATDGLRVMLVGGCSSFKGVSAAVLVHMGWAMAVRTEVGWRDSIAVGATVCLATLINITRLTLTASGYEGYAFWHGAAGETPLGGQMFWFAQNALLLTGGYLSAAWAAGPRGTRVLA
jgi:hypothetical protein